MNLFGPNLILRIASLEDIDVILLWENNPEHWLVSNTREAFSREDIVSFISAENDLANANQLRLMAFDENKMPVGCIDLFDYDLRNSRVGLGILVDKQYRGMGYAKEMLQLVIEHCLHVLNLNSLHAEILEENSASVKLFEGAGFELSGTKKQWTWDGKKFQNQRIYQLLR